jgi:hypothetical protein
MTTKEMTAAELAAGKAALMKSIAETIPAWEVAMAPAGMIENAVATIVAAVDAVRDGAQEVTSTKGN